jgi:hypothetical protein
VATGGDVSVHNNIFYSCGVGISLGGQTFTDNVTPAGTPGFTYYAYAIVGKLADGSVAWLTATPGSTTRGNATLSSSDYNAITWTAPRYNPGVATFDVYRVAGGGTQGKIASGLTTLTYNDTGGAADGTSPPRFVCDYNSYYKLSSNPFYVANYNGQQIPAWKALGYDAHSSMSAQPLLSPGFTLLAPDTVARGQGTNLWSFFNADRIDRSRPATGPWDLGCYQSGRPSPPTSLRRQN